MPREADSGWGGREAGNRTGMTCRVENLEAVARGQWRAADVHEIQIPPIRDAASCLNRIVHSGTVQLDDGRAVENNGVGGRDCAGWIRANGDSEGRIGSRGR